MEVKKVICPNCGAAIYENEASCPFCGYINLTGAEEKFMRDIKKTERDMSNIPDLQKAEYKKTMSKSSRIIFITIGITAIIAAVLIGIYLLFDRVIYSYSGKDVKAQMLWNNENYPILDEMYANGDYDGIVEFEYDLILQGDKGVYLAQKGGEWGLLLVGDAAISEYVDHEVITAAPESSAPGNSLGEPIGTYVAHGEANVRNAPSSDADKIGSIPEDGTVVVYEIVESQNADDNSDFAKIEFEGQIGYVSMGLLDEE